MVTSGDHVGPVNAIGPVLHLAHSGGKEVWQPRDPAHHRHRHTAGT